MSPRSCELSLIFSNLGPDMSSVKFIRRTQWAIKEFTQCICAEIYFNFDRAIALSLHA
jgi:uncharacterized protein (DUF2132 family)